MSFSLDPVLAKDCVLIGELDISLLLLMNNALVPWLILVPKRLSTELTDLTSEDQARVLAEINLVSGFLKNQLPNSKHNIAAIGNVVKQLHIHIIARHADDFCWPDVVWGQTQRESYTDKAIVDFTEKLSKALSITRPS